MLMLASPSADAMSFAAWRKRDYPEEMLKMA